MSFRWRLRRPFPIAVRLAARRVAAVSGVAMVALATGCLDDQATAAGPGGSRAPSPVAFHAQIVGGQAESYEVRVRAFYLREGGQQVSLPVSPSVFTVPSNTPTQQALNLQPGACFADESRAGAPGCRVGIELALLDETGGVLSRASQVGTLERPGVTIQLGGITLPAAALTLDRTALTFAATAGGTVPAAQTVQVGSTTEAELDLGVAVSSGAPGNWLNATFTTRTPEGGVLSIVPSRTDLPAGTYTATVGVSSGRAAIPLQTITVTYNVAAVGTGSIYGRVLNATTGLPIGGITVTSTPTGSTNPAEQRTVTTGAAGTFELGQLPGDRTYDLTASGPGFTTNTAQGVQVGSGTDLVLVNFALPPTGQEQRTGTIVGRVVAAAGGAPVAGATVLISGGQLTNGVFATTTTDANGNFALDAIGLDAPAGPIPSFIVSATAPNFATAAQTVTLPQNRTVANVRLQLPAQGAVTTYFSETVEGNVGTWTMTGLWNQIDLATANVVNTAYPAYVSLAPGDASNGALPAAVQGNAAFWYGARQTGNFIGTQIPDDEPKGGGTSVEPNEGELVSPLFTIPAGAPAAALTFQTWFEIESVNPNENGFDFMEVYVQPVNGTPVLLRRLNPFVDPELSGEDLPFTSGGFNRAPAWRPERFDLSAYRGQQVRLVFRFSTEDELYNGFRGWLLDDIRVTNEAVLPSAQAKRAAPATGLQLQRVRPARTPRTTRPPR